MDKRTDRAGEIILPVGTIQKFSVEDGPGIRTTVFLKGCPLRCRWCHNPEMISTGQEIMVSPNNCIGCGACIEACHAGAVAKGAQGVVIDRDRCDLCMDCTKACYAEAIRPAARDLTVSRIMETVLQDKGFYDNTGGGMTLSGGEFLMHGEGAAALIDAAAAEGIGVCLDTCGSGDGKLLASLASRDNVTDILYDIKSVDDAIHREYTGAGNRKILENLRMLSEDPALRRKITVRMPLIAGVNDDPRLIEETGRLCRELGIERVTILPYHDLGISKAANAGRSQERFLTPPEEKLTQIADLLTGMGLGTEILGRV